MYLRFVLSFVLTSLKFLHKALSRAYAEREYVSLRFAHTVSWFSRQSQHIIFEPPPSFRASGGVCSSKASHRSDLLHHLQKLLKLFSRRRLHFAVAFALRR